MKIDTVRLKGLIEAARGLKPADLCIKGCRLVNVFSGELESADLAVHNGFIAGWGDYEGVQTIRAEGMYASPGFIDGHVHIESSLLSPANFCASVLPWGTSAVVADPHEIANVLGPGWDSLFSGVREASSPGYFYGSAELRSRLAAGNIRRQPERRGFAIPAPARKPARSG